MGFNMIYLPRAFMRLFLISCGPNSRTFLWALLLLILQDKSSWMEKQHMFTPYFDCYILNFALGLQFPILPSPFPFLFIEKMVHKYCVQSFCTNNSLSLDMICLNTFPIVYINLHYTKGCQHGIIRTGKAVASSYVHNFYIHCFYI